MWYKRFKISFTTSMLLTSAMIYTISMIYEKSINVVFLNKSLQFYQPHGGMLPLFTAETEFLNKIGEFMTIKKSVRYLWLTDFLLRKVTIYNIIYYICVCNILFIHIIYILYVCIELSLYCIQFTVNVLYASIYALLAQFAFIYRNTFNIVFFFPFY